MEAHARAFPGFVDVKGSKADVAGSDGGVVAGTRDVHAWATDARHRVAQSKPAVSECEYYKMDVAPSSASEELNGPQIERRLERRS